MISGVVMLWHYQIDEDTHVLLGQPVEEVGWVAWKNLIVVECGDGLDTLLQLLQTRLHTLHLERRGHDKQKIVFTSFQPLQLYPTFFFF